MSKYYSNYYQLTKLHEFKLQVLSKKGDLKISDRDKTIANVKDTLITWSLSWYPSSSQVFLFVRIGGTSPTFTFLKRGTAKSPLVH